MEYPEPEIKNSELTEILQKPSRSVYRYGISVIFILLLLGLLLTNFIRYPEILKANVTLTSVNPPVSLVSKTTGKLTHLFVKDKATVKAKQIIGILENTADYKDILYLEKQINESIESLKKNDSTDYILIKDGLQLGDITPSYLELLKSIKDFNLYMTVNPYNRQILLLKTELSYYKALLENQNKQQKINDEQLKLAETDYERNKTLFDGKAISSREFEEKKKEYLNALNSNEQAKISVSNSYIQINSIEKNILQKQIEDFQEQYRLKSEAGKKLKETKEKINQWKNLYLIESPIDGKISFFNLWTTNQYVQQNEELFKIVPDQQRTFIGKCLLPILNSGKLSIGQKVNIKLDNYPYAENGMLIGQVANYSEVPNKESYSVDIILPNGLKTSYNKTLPYKEEMKGQAEIITQELSVLDRIFFNFKLLTNR